MVSHKGVAQRGFARVQPLHWKAMTGNLFASGAGSPAEGAAEWYTAHCDGGSRGNPGPSGFGAVVEDPRGQVAARLSEYLGKQTNNYAEYSGLLAVLDWAIANQVKRLRVVSDSELMVKQMKGQYQVKSPGLIPLWEEAKRRAARLERFEMRHTLRGGNKEADQLANEAMDRGMGKGPREQGIGIRDQGAGIRDQRSEIRDQRSEIRDQRSETRDQATGRAPQAPPLEAGKPQPPRAPRQVLEGYVKDGVVHLLGGELPDGVFVKIVRE